MGLRSKTALFVGLPVLVLVGLLYTVLSTRSSGEFLKLERTEMSRNLTRAVATIGTEMKALETLTLDWAVYDDAYDYVRGRNPGFEQRTLNENALRAVDLHGIAFQKLDGTPIASRQTLPETGVRQDLENLDFFLNRQNWSWTHESQFIVSGGLVILNDERFLVAQAPVIPASRTAAPQGYVTMIYRLDASTIAEVSRVAQVDVSLHTLSQRSNSQFDNVLEELKNGQKDVQTPTSDHELRGYRLLGKPNSDPLVVISARMTRELYGQGQLENLRLLLSLLVAGLLFFGLTLWVLEKGLLSRLLLLRRELGRIAQDGDTAHRVTVTSNDELTEVQQHVNMSLQRIEHVQTHNTDLEGELRRAREMQLEEVIETQTHVLEATRLELFERLARVAEFRDDQTGKHNKRVGDLAAHIAAVLNVQSDELGRLRYAARLHDIGKIAIPDGILFKPDKLTPEEWALMKTHTLLGAQMLERSNSPLLEMARTIALTHHERWDGAGYPESLAGPNIPLVGRIVAVADAFDAMTSARPYKAAWTQEETLEEIERCSGTHFDPQVVTALLEAKRSFMLENQALETSALEARVLAQVKLA
jgi:HD-GYP domain-containing protein (c-di-GMP phosphodiesterase class II)/sensor domain CHASE-containing protein